MALSRIWSAFIIIAIFVAGYHFFFNNSRDDIFSRMVTGTSKDEFKFAALGDSAKVAGIGKEMKTYGYVLQNAIDKDTRYIAVEDLKADTVVKLQKSFPAARVVAYDYILGRKQKAVDGIIETCWVAVEICLKLIYLLAL
jgi:hypothetical protein